MKTLTKVSLEVASVVEISVGKAFLHHFPNCPAVCLYRGGDVDDAHRETKETVS